MVLRKAGYEGAVYREQLDKREIYPVIGVVLYWGKKRWRVPQSLHELLRGHFLQAETGNGETDIHADAGDDMASVQAYVDDIRLHVFEMAHLPVEIRRRFKSDMRIVVDYLAEGTGYVPTAQRIKHPEALLLLLEALTGDSGYSKIVNRMMEEERKGGTVTMCGLLDKYWKSGIEQGIEQGIERGEENAILTSIKNLMKNLQLTVNQAMEALEIPPEKQEKYLQML